MNHTSRFFNVSDIVAGWRQAQQMAEGFVPFASNGGGEWYGYDSRSPQRPFVLLPAVGMGWDDAMLLGATWKNLLVQSFKNFLQFLLVVPA